MREGGKTVQWLDANCGLLFGAVTYVIYLLSLAYNILRHTLWPSTYRWYDRVDDHVILGARPTVDHVREVYAQEGVRTVVNMTRHYAGPAAEYERLGIRHIREPTLDFTAPTLAQLLRIVEVMQKTAAEGHSTYVHCKAGRGRAATAALAWLLLRNPQWSPERAQRELELRRPHVAANLCRRQVVSEFVARVRGGDGGLDLCPSSHTESSPLLQANAEEYPLLVDGAEVV
mmetsp:Transcript_9161/g.37759  ORF Transcript_9161/g.37759 Transcript_9161/m.37759 type:complete len:230 (-) Transcript_9161:2629-3318(-)